MLTGLAQQAAVAIEQARLHGASLRQTGELAALLRAVRTMLGGLDTRTILEEHRAGGLGHPGTRHVKLLLVDRASGALRVSAQVGGSMPVEGETAVGDGNRQVARTGQPLFADEMPTSDRR